MNQIYVSANPRFSTDYEVIIIILRSWVMNKQSFMKKNDQILLILLRIDIYM